MNAPALQQFEYLPGMTLRVLYKDGEPWFVAKDVGTTLGLTNLRVTLADLDPSEKGVSTVYTLGGNQRVTIITESGLYLLVLKSRKAEAKAFQKWVTGEVLPSIRKTGGLYLGHSLPETTAHNPCVSRDAPHTGHRPHRGRP